MPSLKGKLMVTGTRVVWSKCRELNRFQRFFRGKTGRQGDGVVMVVSQREVSKMTPKFLVCPTR